MSLLLGLVCLHFTASLNYNSNPHMETKYENKSITLQSTHTKIIPVISINEWCHIDWKMISKWFIFKKFRLTSSASSSLACVFPFVFVSAIFNDSYKRPWKIKILFINLSTMIFSKDHEKVKNLFMPFFYVV